MDSREACSGREGSRSDSRELVRALLDVSHAEALRHIEGLASVQHRTGAIVDVPAPRAHGG